MSKVSENILYNQLHKFKKGKLSNILTGAQYSLLIMTEKWSWAFDENMKVGAIFMDLSKAFNMLNQILLAKLKLYGLQSTALKQMESYLTGRFQRINISFETIANIRQGPLLFNTFLDNLFLYLGETFLSNYADDNTLYSIGNTIENAK